MLNIILGVCFYNVFEDYMKKDNKTYVKLIDNNISFFHVISALTFITQSYLFNYPAFFNFLITSNSLGYFLNDTLRFIKRGSLKKSDYILIYHHIIAIIYISSVYQTQTSYWKEILLTAEISNIPTIINYNYIQHNKISNGKYENQLRELVPIQMVWYGGFRVIGLSYLTYSEVMNNTMNIYLFMTLPMILLGYVWTYSLFVQYNLNKSLS